MQSQSSNAERLQYLFLNMVGQVVQVHTADGAITKGLFVSRTDPQCTDEEPGIILSCTYFMRSEVHNALDKADFSPEHKKFAYKDIMFIDGQNIKVRTDIPITAQRQQYRGEHDLKAIDFTEDVKCEVLQDESHHLGHWDQFEENKKFGIKSTFNEELYTTKLDHNKFTKEQFETAEKIAREIERGPTHGIMHRVERNEIALESEDDALYSDVTRIDGRKAHSPNLTSNTNMRSPNRTSSPRGFGSNNAVANNLRKNDSKASTITATTATTTTGSAKRTGAPVPHTIMKDGPTPSPRSPPSPTPATSLTKNNNNSKVTSAELTGGSGEVSNKTGGGSHSVSAAIQTANGEINSPTTTITTTNKTPTPTPGHVSQPRKITVIDDFLKTIADAITHNQDNYNNSAEWPGAGNSYDEDDSYYSADAHRNEAYMSSAIHHNSHNTHNHVNGAALGGGAGGTALPYPSRTVNDMNPNPMYPSHNPMMHPMSLPTNANVNTGNNPMSMNSTTNASAGMSMMPHSHQHQHPHMAMANPPHGHLPNMGSMNANMHGNMAGMMGNNPNVATTTTTPSAVPGPTGMNVNMSGGHPTVPAAAGMMPSAPMHHGHMHGNMNVMNNNNSSSSSNNVNTGSSHNTPGSLVNPNAATNSNMMPANPNVNVGGYMPPHHGMGMNMNTPNMSGVGQMGYNRPSMGFVPSPQQQPQPQQVQPSPSQQLSPPQQQQGSMPASSLAHPSPHHQFAPNMNVGNMNPMMGNNNMTGSGGNTNTNSNNNGTSGSINNTMHMHNTPQPSNMGMPNSIPPMMPLQIPPNHYQGTMANQPMNNLVHSATSTNPHSTNTMANTMNSMNMNVSHSANNTPGSLGNHPMPSHSYMDANINVNAPIQPSQGTLNSSNTTTNTATGTGGMHMANQMNLMHSSPNPNSASRMPMPASQTRPSKVSQPQQPVSVTQSLQPSVPNSSPHPPSSSATNASYPHTNLARPASLHASPAPALASSSTSSTSATVTAAANGTTKNTTTTAANGSNQQPPLTSSTSQSNNNNTGGAVPAVDSSSSSTAAATATSTSQSNRHAASGSHSTAGAQPTKQLRRGGGAGGNARSSATASASNASAAESSKKKQSRFTADKVKQGKVKEKEGKHKQQKQQKQYQ